MTAALRSKTFSNQIQKYTKRFLMTTAITAIGLTGAANDAKADPSWTDHDIVSGSTTVTTPTSTMTNIEQHTNFVKAIGSANIADENTVNIDQPTTSSKYVLYGIENEGSYLGGKLNANGQVWILNTNGIFIGKNAHIDTGSFVASTAGTVDITEADTLTSAKFKDFGDGKIVNNGTVTVAQAGLAGFVSPFVSNSGVINARMGSVVMAGGETVTMDMYGDGLVEVAVDGELADGYIENKGTINAQGGRVIVTAAVAKDAVEEVINMDGVVDVSSVSVKGGKIILSGGNKGTVRVGGKLDASGTEGGNIDVTGQDIVTEASAELIADSNDYFNAGGKIVLFANRRGNYSGEYRARG